MRILVSRYDAFTTRPNRGNPAGVVFDAQRLSEEQMQELAKRLGFNETAFVLPSETADIQLRYFTPGHEVELCGHATVASIYALYENRLLAKSEFLLETKAGLLPIAVEIQDSLPKIWMTQKPAQFVDYTGDREALAAVIGLRQDELDASLPIVYGSTGLWTLILPVKGIAAMRKMQPRNQSFPSVLEQMPRASIHPICLETIDPKAQMHARHFSSPYSGTIEDSVTGTASGVMGAYFNRYIGTRPLLTVEQGIEIGRDGRVTVAINGETVRIAGTAVFSGEIELSLESS